MGDSWTATPTVLDVNPTNRTGEYCCLQVVNSTVFVAYFDFAAQRIAFRKSVNDGATWSAKAFVSRPSAFREGEHLSLTLLAGNQMAFASAVDVNVLYTHSLDAGDTQFDDYGTVWTIPPTQSVSPCILEASGRPALFHSDNGVGWRFSYTLPANWFAVDGGYVKELGFTFQGSQQTGILADQFSCGLVAGNPAAAYYDSTNKQLWYTRSANAQGSDTAWTVSVIDAARAGSHIGSAPSFLPNVNGQPAVAYSVNASLVYARASTATGLGGAWQQQPPAALAAVFSPPPGATIGNVSLSNSSIVTLLPGSSIVVTGQVALAGILTVTVVPANGSVTLVTAQALSGKFASVVARSTFDQPPACPQATFSTSYTSISVLLAVNVPSYDTTPVGSTATSESLSAGAIVGFAIACVVVAALGVVLACLGRKAWGRKDRSRNKQIRLAHSQAAVNSTANLAVHL